MKDMTMRKRELPKEPINELKTLCGILSRPEVARLLGISPPSISEMLSTGECRPVYNKAAAYELQKRSSENTSKMLYFVRVPREKREVFEAFISGMGFQSRTFTDD